MRQIEQLDPGIIAVPSRHRSLDSEAVGRLGESIKSVGLRTPITVRIVDGWEDGDQVFDGQPVLVTGRHRLEAVRSLGWASIECFVFDGDDEIDAELWEIAENLHRAELTAQQRSDHIAEWMRLVEAKQEREREQQEVSRQVGDKPQGGRPESGTAAASRELGISDTQARRAKLIASIPEDAKQAAEEAGLSDNQSALERIAKAGDPLAEVRVIKEERKAREAEAEERRQKAKQEDKQSQEQAQAEQTEREYRNLITAWGNARPSVRQRFREFVSGKGGGDETQA